MFAKGRKGHPGNATGSGIHGQTDYDIPRPNVPRKLGGSCEDLLSIEFISYDDDAEENDHAPRTSLPGGKLPARLDFGAAAGGGGKKGGRRRMAGSCDDVLALSTENLSLSNASSGIDVGREYDVPVSLSPEVHDLPGSSSHSKRKLDRAGMAAVITGSAQRADVDARWQQQQQKQASNQSDNQQTLYSGRHRMQMSAQTKTMDQSFGRDSALADYDVPTSGKNRFKNEAAKGGSDAKNDVMHGVAKAADSVETKTRPPPAAAAAAIVCDRSFFDSVQELQKAVDQVIDYSDRWQACRNWETRKSIVKQVCLSVWNKLQALLVDFSKLLVRIKGAGPLRDRYGALKVSSANLEEILGHVERCRPNEVTLNFVNELKITAQDIKAHVDYCVSVIRGDFGDIFQAPGRVIPPQNSPPPPQQQQQQQQQTHRRRSPPTLPPNPKIVLEICESGTSGSFINEIDRHSKPSTFSGNSRRPSPPPTATTTTSPQRFLRSVSHGNGLVDYDFPRPEGDRGGGGEDGGSRIRRESRPPSDEFTKAKRSAIAFGEKRESFSILERRNPRSPIMPSKLIVAGKTSPNIAQSPASPRLNSSGTAEYDFPKPTETSHRTPTSGGGFPLPSSSSPSFPLTAGDRRAIEFYGHQMAAELERLDAACRTARETLRPVGSSRQVAHDGGAAHFDAVALASRRVVFICDAVAKNIANSALRRKLRDQSGAIVSATKAIPKSLLNSAAGASLPAFSRHAYLQRIDEVMSAALAIGELLSLGTPKSAKTGVK